MIVRIVHIYNYMVIIGCQLEWAYPILTELCANRLRWFLKTFLWRILFQIPLKKFYITKCTMKL